MSCPGVLQCGEYRLNLTQPVVMGVLNVTPDSFSDGGAYPDLQAVLDRGRQMVEQGAAIVDVGGESTRPGSLGVDVAEEKRRVLPVIEVLASELSVPISIDTRKPEVMREAIAVGASMVNDVAALRESGGLEVVARSKVAVCLMHMQGEPATMQQDPTYVDVVAEVREFLEARVAACRGVGIASDRLVIDPGFGFGKTLAHNLQLLDRLAGLRCADLPLLVGLSLKGMIGTLTGRPTEGRLAGSLALATLAVARGASIIRAHDVAETVDAVRVAVAVCGNSKVGGTA
ncbi:MAG: dihydropteroate synthase [Steroidobacteraceae bacterium]